MTESAEQKSLLRWWHMSHKGLGVPDARLLFAIPNGAYLGGGKIGARRGARLKGEGLVAGVPDVGLFIPKQGWHGLFIEMKKSDSGRVSQAQLEMHKLLIGQGYAVVIANGYLEAINVIEKYLGE